MSNPYALDFNPLAQAFQNKAQVDLARNRLSMDEDRLAMEQQRQAWEGQLQPFRVESARLGNVSAQQGITREDKMLPLDISAKNASIAGQGLTNTHLKQQIADHADKQIVGVMQTINDRLKANPNDAAAIADYRAIVSHPEYRKRAIEYGMDPNDPLSGSQKLIARVRGYQDDLDQRLKKTQVEGAEETLQATRALRQDLNPGTVSTPQSARGIPATGPGQAPSASPAQPGQPPAPNAPPVTPGQQGQLPAPLINMAKEWQQAQRLIASGVPAYVQAGEAKMKMLNSMWDKGTILAQDGSVIPAPGAIQAETQKKEAEVAATERGKVTGTAQATYADAERSAGSMLRKLQAIEDHPALSRSTGPVMGALPAVTSGARDFQARLEEIQGGTFMQAFNALKGGGQITEKEGEKATASLNRLREQKVGTQEWLNALKEFKSDIISLADLAAKKAGVQTAPQPPAKGDVFRMGGVWYQYLGGDLKDPKSYKQVNQ